MTATTETAGTATSSTELAQVAPGLIAEIEDSGTFTVADLADKLVSPDRTMDSKTPFPPVPSQVEVTDALKARMRQLPSVFGKVRPTTRRELEPTELTSLSDEVSVIDALSTILGERRKQIGEAIRVHQDVHAERTGDAKGATRVAEGKAQGHYLLAKPGDPFNTEVPGYKGTWQQRFVKGKSRIDEKLLAALVRDEVITKAEFNAMTRTVRVLDHDKLAVAIRKNPGRFLRILASITRKGAPSASLYPPKN
jgi:hypothetical protein